MTLTSCYFPTLDYKEAICNICKTAVEVNKKTKELPATCPICNSKMLGIANLYSYQKSEEYNESISIL